jgi:hypothetical protein
MIYLLQGILLHKVFVFVCHPTEENGRGKSSDRKILAGFYTHVLEVYNNNRESTGVFELC